MDFLPLILVGLICLVLGFATSTLIHSLRNEPARPVSPETDDPNEPVARLWREAGSGRLVVELDGHPLSQADTLHPDQRERLEQASRELSAWLGASNPPAGPASQDGLTSQSEPANLAPAGGPSGGPANGAAAASVVIVSPAADLTQKSIVMQIEDILQDRITGGPLDGRGIHLHETPDSGVTVTVDGKTYPGIDAVEAPEVKAAIQAAVAHWERRAVVK